MDKNDKSEKLLNEVFKGNSLIIKNVFDKQEIIDLKNSIFEIENSQDESNYRMLDECPNFHVSNKKNNIAPIKDNYDETAHSHYFFRWNKDEINIFQKFDKIWDLIKIFSGLEKDSYKKNKDNGRFPVTYEMIYGVSWKNIKDNPNKNTGVIPIKKI